MILARMIVGDTLVLGFLVGTSCMNATDRFLLMVLPEKMASSRIFAHPSKYRFVLCNWCSSSSSNFEVIGDF
jgi:hypothetical protein